MATTANKTKKEIPEGYKNVFVPRGAYGEPDLEVGVNGKFWTLARGEYTVVPDFVAAEVERAAQAEDNLHDTEKAYANMQPLPSVG